MPKQVKMVNNYNSRIKTAVLVTSLTAIALTGIGCSSTQSREHTRSNRPIRVGMSSQANREYIARQKANENPRVEHTRPYDTATSACRFAYTSNANNNFNIKHRR